MIQEELTYFIQLLDDEQLYPIILSNMLKSIDTSIPLVEKALKLEKYNKYQPKLLKLYNELYKAYSREKLNLIVYKDYISLQELWLETSIFLFENDKTEWILFQRDILETLARDISPQLSWKLQPNEVLKVVNNSIHQYFIVDNEDKTALHNFTKIQHSKAIHNNTLALIYIMIAEKLELPIFGLPISDSIILCFTKEHCHHNEMVYEDDILFYFSPANFGVVYTLEDLELYALTQGQSLSLKSKLPKSNLDLISHWCDLLKSNARDISLNHNLVEKFKQLDEMFKISG